ncbi:unnamed protein product [Adineta steineri]|uniref:YihY/virulence factor BrkB family protein n=1 Tax=Adineta steineri TaxID=433720 RepID=A0A813ZUV4_9BILA|nr:unnamed protein product [Adineta steineri]CAF1402809.1 unnamed protein product [Adineta steineri]
MMGVNAKEKFGRFKFHSIQFFWKIVHDWSFSLSSLIGYNLLVSLLPLILCLFSIATLIFQGDQAVIDNIRNRLINAFPKDEGIADIIDGLLKSLSQQAGLVFLITFCVSVFAGSRLMIGIDDVLTIIYRIRERSAIDQNIHAIKMLLSFIILMPLLLISSSAPAVLTKHEGLAQIGTALGSAIFGFLLFELIYYNVPNRKMLFRNTWAGALAAAIGLQILLSIFPMYVHSFMSNYVGQLGFVIVAVLLFYLFGLVLVIGAQINAYFFDHIQPLPVGLGTLLSRNLDNENAILIDGNLQPKDNTSTLIEGLNPLP